MAVDDPTIVDAIGIEQSSGDVVLTIADHLEWEPFCEHWDALKLKVDAYLSYVENNEFRDSYPRGMGKPIRIDVWCKHEPTARANQSLLAIKKIIEVQGISFSWQWSTA